VPTVMMVVAVMLVVFVMVVFAASRTASGR
jgi:hypothetical protein